MATLTLDRAFDLEHPILGSRSSRAMARFAVGVAALCVVTAVAVLALWATVMPLAIGWQPLAIMSGSMEPLIGVGDVLVAEPYSGQELQPGMVIVFESHAWGGLVSHRIETVNADDTLTTRGDANRNADSTPVPRDEVVGVGRLVVTEIGWPTVWAGTGNGAALALAALGLCIVIYAARWGVLERFDPWRTDAVVATRGRHRAPPRKRWSVLTGRWGAEGVALLLASSFVLVGGSSAVLASTTASGGNNFAAATFAPPSNLQLSASCLGTPIAFRAASTSSGKDTVFVVNKPSGTVLGDTMLIHIVLETDEALTVPSGWSLVRRSTTAPFSAIYVKVAGAAEPASYTWGIAKSIKYAVGLGTWSNVHSVTPINAHGGAGATGSSIVAPSITTSVPNTMLVAFWSIRDTQGVTVPGSVTKRWEIASTGGQPNKNVLAAGGTEFFVGTGATGARTALSPVSEQNVGQLVALRPAAPAVPTVTATWTATPSTMATGYKLQRWLGPVLQTEQTITPRTTTVAADLTVSGGQTYTYKLFAFFNTWTSTQITQTVTTPPC